MAVVSSFFAERRADTTKELRALNEDRKTGANEGAEGVWKIGIQETWVKVSLVVMPRVTMKLSFLIV